MATEKERLREIFRNRLWPSSSGRDPKQPYVLIFLLWWLPLFGTVSTGIWTVKTYLDAQIKDQKKEQEEKDKAQDERIKAEEARLLEAKKPYLSKRLDLFFEASKVGGALAAYSEDIGAPEWKSAELRFWALRWSELEMVGNPVLRERLRDLQKSIVALKKDPKNKEMKHNVRWKAECVADELRETLDSDWSQHHDNELNDMFEASNPSKEPRYVSADERRKRTPSGCFGFRDDIDDTSEIDPVSTSAESPLPQSSPAPPASDRK